MKNYFWNMFANIKNGQLARKSFIYQKRKKICEELLKVLWEEGFILGFRISIKNSNFIKIFLKYKNEIPIINYIYIISKPSRRIYYSLKQIWKIKSNKSCIIISTNQGFKTIVECKKLGIGGEPVAVIN